MFSGAQVSLYPMSGNFAEIILNAVKGLDPYRDVLRIETDDISTLMVGPPDVLFSAMRDLFVIAAKSGEHCVLSAAVSRGCPGEPDDPACGATLREGDTSPLAERIGAALATVLATPTKDQAVAAQFSLYVMGTDSHMDEIYGCIDFLKRSGTFDRSKNFCTRLRGDAGTVFATLQEAFCRFGPPEGHVTLDITISANSPTKA
ncbi:YkoF family thiamine/hydroxymethylpyrimidine-binding protein [Rhizobium tubonense]|uniref:HMP/thiamine-binding protein n=1 Tax=Rhizobium tubonense TaxID=484088 RepID=A0A2W4EEZ0_9HYPH|nr:YkoF family thiamine/hydroxymethylpyrimidine-binding protein [Rhizobium tubonense]PZM09840.1 HMP/thiamine-binding protein [Rhizobium tubonense]